MPAPNRSDRRFCAQCGAALAVICPACRLAHQLGEKFCGGCGTALGAPRTHGDDPERAIRAALAVRATLPEDPGQRRLALAEGASRSRQSGRQAS